MLEAVSQAMERCSGDERAKLARFFAAQAEEKLDDRPGASRIFSWLGVVAAARTPHEITLSDIPEEDRMYVRDLAVTLEAAVRSEAALDATRTPDDLERLSEDRQQPPVAEVWRELVRTMEDSIA